MGKVKGEIFSLTGELPPCVFVYSTFVEQDITYEEKMIQGSRDTPGPSAMMNIYPQVVRDLRAQSMVVHISYRSIGVGRVTSYFMESVE